VADHSEWALRVTTLESPYLVTLGPSVGAIVRYAPQCYELRALDAGPAFACG